MSEVLHGVLRYPHITEKSTLEKEKREGRVVAFKVAPDATKTEIKRAVETIFEVKVEKVRTANYMGKVKRQGRYSGRRPLWKKAYVTLKPGQKEMEFFEGV